MHSSSVFQSLLCTMNLGEELGLLWPQLVSVHKCPFTLYLLCVNSLALLLAASKLARIKNLDRIELEEIQSRQDKSDADRQTYLE